MTNKKINKIEAMIAVFLILLTISMPLTFTALQPEFDVIKNEAKINPVVDSFALIISKTISFFDVIPNAAALETGCCKVTKLGAKCQTVADVDCDMSKGFFLPQKTCTEIDPNTGMPYCQLGCCIDSEGRCNKNSISSDCPVPPALDFNIGDLECKQNPICAIGCCTVGYQRFPSTNKSCQGRWEPNVPPDVCLSQPEPADLGCCRYRCSYETAEECAKYLGIGVGQLGDKFVRRKCYDSVPGCEACTAKANVSCVEGFSDLYWADSCGNAYVDEVNNPCSKNNEFCNASASPNECQAGTCVNVYDNFKSSKDFTALPGRHGQTRANGESWCVYDRPDLVWGNGTEPSGSRHLRCYCVQGKEYCEPCSDYRQQICVETLFDLSSGQLSKDVNYTQRYQSGNYRSIATCVGNPWRTCILLAEEEDCNKNPGCFWITSFAPLVGKEVSNILRIEDGIEKGWAGVRADTLTEINSGDPNLGTIIGPPRCLPKIPPGLDTGFNQFQNKETICNLGSYQCTVEDRLLGGDKNPECDDHEWMELMAHRCRAIADCGAWFNYLYAPTGKSTATQEGILIAEVTPEYDGEGKVTAKEIETNFKLLDNDDFEHYQQIIENPFKIFEMGGKGIQGGWGWSILTAIGLYFGIVWILPNAPWGLTLFSKTPSLLGAFWSGDKMGLLNVWTITGALFLLIAEIIPGPTWLKESFRSIGYGFTAKGIAMGLGAGGPASWAIGGAVLVIYALFFAVWDVDHIVVQCMPYTPPAGGDDCDKCNDDPMRPCSKYRCESLGTACFWNGETADGIPCEQSEESECGVCQKEDNDGTPPLITKVSVKEEGYNVLPQQPGMPPSTIIISKSGGIDPWTSFNVQLDFNERAVCKWYNKHTLRFEDMPTIWFGSNTWKRNQTMTIPVGKLIEGYNTVQIYLRCADSYMNANIGEYILQFTVSTTDMSPPFIYGTDRDYNKKFGYGVTELPLWIYVNEMAKCKWAKQDVDYSLMGGECITTLTQTGFKCNTTLTGLQSEPPGIANYFYIRCNDTSGNVMPQSYQLVLYPTLPLKIINIVPENGAYVKGCEISGVELKVETAEGSENGKAICYWQNGTQWQRFSVTNDIIHLTNLSAVSQTVNIKCVDSALNVATNSTTFTVEADQTPPIITRIYKDSGSLVIRTDEKATCAYHYSMGKKINDCNFAANDTMRARKFSSTGALEHSTSWDTAPWFVKCYDECNNGINEPCTIIYPSDVD